MTGSLSREKPRRAKSAEDLLDLDQLLALGLDPADARDVLGPHSALSRQEVLDRYGILCRERRGQP
jgi:hypothetical protein